MQGIPGSVLFCSLQWISLTGKLKLARPRFLCSSFKTLHAFGYLVISKNVREDQALLTDTWHVSFSVFCVWFPFDFPLPHSVSCEGFSCFQQPRLKYMKTAHLLSTLPPSCLHLKATQWQETVRVFSLRAECILQPPGRTFFLLKQTPCFLMD